MAIVPLRVPNNVAHVRGPAQSFSGTCVLLPLWTCGMFRPVEMAQLDPSMKIAKYFTLSEVIRSSTASRLGIKNVPDKAQLANLKRAASTLLDPIREEFGVVRVTSGLRVAELNAAIPGSSTTSYHCFGLAFDFRVVGARMEIVGRPDGSQVAILVGAGRAQFTPTLGGVMDWIVESNLPYDQVIYEYGSWIHIGAAKDGKEPRKQALMKFAGERYKTYDPADSRVV